MPLSSAITVANLRAVSNFEFSQILSFNMCIQPGAHATMELRGVPGENFKGLIASNWFGATISVVYANDEGQEKKLFCGYIANARQDDQDDYRTITVEALSATWLMDIYRESKSFQNIGLTYGAIFDSICEETQNADCIFTVQDQTIGKPIIRYKETGWGFGSRMAADRHTSLIPDVLSHSPHFYIGVPSKQIAGEIQSVDYTFGCDRRYYEFAHDELGLLKQHIAYYDVRSYDSYEVGEKVRFMGRLYAVVEKHGKLENGILVFTYRLSFDEYACAKAYHNPELKGVSLRGTVLETQEEHVKVHLDIDESQDAQEAYPYEWKPESGNIMYLMPQVGTKVNLYIPSCDETSAYCTECVRENGEVHPEMVPTDRYLTTEHGMRLRMLPDQFGFLSFNSQSKFEIMDAFGGLFQSSAALNIKADGDVTLAGSSVFLNAPQEISVVCRRWDMPSVINLCHDFDLIGKQSRFDSNIPLQPDVFLNFPDGQATGAMPYSLDGHEKQILAAVPLGAGNDEAVNAALDMNIVFGAG